MADNEEEFEIPEDELEILDYAWTKEHAVHDLAEFMVAHLTVVADYILAQQLRFAADSNHKVIANEMHARITKDIESLPEVAEPVFKEPESDA